MALKMVYATKAEVPADVAHLYVERDGCLRLDVSDGVPLGTFSEERARRESAEARLKAFDGLDAGAARKALEQAGKGGGGETVDGVRKEAEERIRAVMAERDLANERMATMQIEGQVMSAAAACGVRRGAATDLLGRARSVLRIIDGQVRVVGNDGKSLVYGADGVKPMTVEEWVRGLQSEAGHLFGESAGGGASGSGSGAGAAMGKNPFERGPNWNVTRQMELMRNEPALAERLRLAAG